MKIPESIKENWQQITNLLTGLLNVPVALITYADNEYIEIIAAGDSGQNPFEVGQRELMNNHYCEEVIKSKKELHIANALLDEQWKNNPDLNLGLIAYLGYPIKLPNNDIFGTLCVLDTRENIFIEMHRKLMQQFVKLIENNLATEYLHQNEIEEFENQFEAKKEILSSTEERLNASEEKYWKLFEENCDSIAISLINSDGTAGKIVECNNRLTQLLGYSKIELLNATPVELEYGPLREKVVEKLGTIADRGEIGFETKLIHKEGYLVDCEVKAVAIEFEHQKAILNIVRDITERKLFENQLIQLKNKAEFNEELLNNAQKTAKVGNWIWYMQEDRLWWSDEMYEIFDIDKESFTGKLSEVISRSIHPDDLNLVKASNASVIEQNKPIPVEYRIITGSNQIKYVFGLADELEVDSKGKSVKLSGIVKDITEYKQIQTELIYTRRELAEKNYLQESILQTIPYGMDIVAHDGTILYQNAKLSEIFKDEGIGKKCWELYRDNEQQCDNCPLKHEIHIGKTATIEVDGALNGKTLQISHTGIMYNGSKAFLEVFHDITLRKKHEKELVAAKEKAEENEALQSARLHLIKFAENHASHDVIEEIINIAEDLTTSSIGFFHYVDEPKQTISLQNWSTRTKKLFCKAEGFGEHYPIEKAGVWADCIRLRTPVIHNDFEQVANKKGMPPGHAKVHRELILPIFINNQMKAILGIGNKITDYTPKDLELINQFADYAWEIMEHKLANDKIIQLSKAVESVQTSIVITDKLGNIEYANPFFTKITGYTETEYLMQNPRLLKSGEQTQAYYKELWDSINSGNTWEGQFHNKKKNGELYWENAIISPIKNENDEIVNFVAVKSDITENKQITEELIKAKDIAEASETKFRAAFYTSPDAVNINKLNGEYVEINEGFTRLTGFTKEDAIGKLSAEINIWAIPEDREKLVKGLKENGIVENLESLFRAKDGRLIPALMSARLILLKDEPHILSVTRDISQRKAFEEELIAAKNKAEEHERKLIQAQSLARLGSWELDISSKIFTFTNSFYRIFHTNADEMGGYQMSADEYTRRFVHPDDAAKVEYETQKAIDTTDPNYSQYVEHRMRYHSGGEGYIGVKIFVVKDKNGKTIKTYGVNQDITDRTLIQQELIDAKVKAEKNEQLLQIQKSEIELNNERLESLLRIANFEAGSIQQLLDYALEEAIKLTNSKIGYIYFYDEENQLFTLNTWSKEVMKECAVENQQCTYQLVKTGCWGEAVRQRQPFIINDFNTGSSYIKGTPAGHVQLKKFLTIPVFSDKKIVAVAGVANKSTDYNKQDIRQLTLLMDNVWKISEKINLVATLKESKEKAEESDRLKTAFLQNMSHEIRTPMNAIMGFSQLMVTNLQNKSKIEHFSSIINQRCNDLLKLIDDLLDISKIESGSLVAHAENCHVKSIIAELYFFFTEYQKRIAKQQVQLLFNIHLIGDDKMIWVDQGKLKQVFINLINNAFKFTEQGSVEFGCSSINSKEITFFVSDTGIGIPTDKFDLIFERFSQINHGADKIYGGTGLGLSIAKGLVTLMGGTIWVESEIGKGSVFYFTIPCQQQDTENSPVTELKDEQANFDFTHLKILIVEDDVYNLNYLNELFDDKGANILNAINGNEAIKMAMEHKPDIILLDIGLPDVSGYDVAKTILDKWPEAKIIAQTAFASFDDKRKAFDCGCVDYISKPLKTALLYQLIDKHVNT